MPKGAADGATGVSLFANDVMRGRVARSGGSRPFRLPANEHGRCRDPVNIAFPNHVVDCGCVGTRLDPRRYCTGRGRSRWDLLSEGPRAGATARRYRLSRRESHVLLPDRNVSRVEPYCDGIAEILQKMVISPSDIRVIPAKPGTRVTQTFIADPRYRSVACSADPISMPNINRR